MIRNFEETKKQLNELSGVINSFKSEAVQLKIIEMIFATRTNVPSEISAFTPEQPVVDSAPKIKTSSRTSSSKSKQSPRAMSGSGAIATLNRTFEAGFFKQPRSINAIIQHCETNLARKIRANEISGKLARMVRSNQLKRAKNSDGQYEYTNH
jgi:hypothetical protein